MDEVQTLGGYMQKPNPFVFRNSSSCEDLNSGFGAAFSFCSVYIVLWVLLIVITIGSYRNNKCLLRIFGELMAKSRDFKHGFSFKYGVFGLFRSKISSCLIGSGKFSKNRPVEEKSVKICEEISEKSAKEEGKSHGDGPRQENSSCLAGGGIGGGGNEGGVAGAGSGPSHDRVVPSQEISSSSSQAEEKSDKISKEVGGQNSAEVSEEMSMEELKEAIEIEREEKNTALTELDKERMSSALAANEAMNMIMRLQSEKSSIQMEANQSKRLAEQKQQYDQEIIQSLQWVIFKHESDITVLENQLRLCKLKLKQCLKLDEMEQFEEELMNCANVVDEDGASMGSHDTGSETSMM